MWLSRVIVSALLAAPAVVVIPPAPSRAAAAPRIEVPVPSSSPITDVAESVVRVKVPLPGSAGSHPPECDWLSYLRYRDRGGPAASASADKILIAQPGILEGAGAFDSVARNTIVRAADKGRHIEFWALDRRANCLEDNTGVRAALAAKDPHVAVDYYYRHKPVNGHRFAGYLDNRQVRWLEHVGLEQTLRDQYDLMVSELPDPAVRRRKALCGGHSLGGSLTGFFAVWDFDGDHATTADAGYNQCSGYFALDTAIKAGPIGMSQTVPSGALPDTALGPQLIQSGLQMGIIPRTISGPALINAETMNLLAIAGASAAIAPGGRSDLATYIPSNLNQDLTYRFLFSRNLGAFVTGRPGIKDFNLTNAAALGSLLDDNAEPLAFIQTSVGFYGGGKIVDKDFPLPNQLARIPALQGFTSMLGKESKAIPARPRGPLYTWRNYDRVGPAGGPVARSEDGTPFTTPAKEVTDLGELARSLSEHPLDFTEDYFPTRIATDIQLSGAFPGVAKDAVHQNGITANPTLTVLAGDGLFPPDGSDPSAVVAPGYQHLDVLTAARVQNNGRPEPVSLNLAQFAMR
ncbi:MAG: hypothetical protein JWO67_5110 [Streptosporangiaceae bacterium]|nr:hypothetical protein [Streptosporangiaceae bacterium]